LFWLYKEPRSKGGVFYFPVIPVIYWRKQGFKQIYKQSYFFWEEIKFIFVPNFYLLFVYIILDDKRLVADDIFLEKNSLIFFETFSPSFRITIKKTNGKNKLYFKR
jgi:hypothetical protein